MGELLIQAVLDKIQSEMERLYWNKYQKELGNSPFQNCGTQYINDTFAVRSYCWSDTEEELPNFEYKDFFCYWYKYSHRGLEWYYKYQKNVIPDQFFLDDMLANCIESMIIDFDPKGEPKDEIKPLGG